MAASVEYKTILNGLAMCVSSNSKRDRRSARPWLLLTGIQRRPRSPPRSHSTARFKPIVPLRNANEISQTVRYHEGLLFRRTAPGPD